MFTLELFFLLNRMLVVHHKSIRRGFSEFADSTIIQFVNSRVEGLRIYICSMTLKLGVGLSKLILKSLSLTLQFIVVKLMLWLSINTELLFI